MSDCIDSAGCIVFENKKVLLVHYFSHYSFPKGHIEKGETREECAVRETKEESGIDAVIVAPPITVPSQKPGDMRNVYFFPSLYAGGDLMSQKGETDEVLWVSIDEALELLSFDADRSALLSALRVVRVDIE